MEYTKLIEWIKENGGFVDEDIYVNTISTGNRSLCTKNPKKESSRLIQIPKKCTIFSYTDNMYDTCINFIKEYSNSESFYKPYFNTLPTVEQFKCFHPLYLYDKSDLKEIEEICAKAAVCLKKSFEEVDTLYSKLCETKEILTSCQTVECAKFCIAMYYTRGWKDCGFVPLVDMMQHVQESENTHSLMPMGNFVSLYCKACESGELTACYKTANQIELYVQYGILENDINFLDISLEIPSLTLYQKNCLIKNRLFSNPITLHFSNKNLVLNTIKKARIISILDKEIKSETLFLSNTCISIDNDRRAIMFLRKVLQQLIIPEQQTYSEKYFPIHVLAESINSIIKNTLNELNNMWLSYLQNEK